MPPGRPSWLEEELRITLGKIDKQLKTAGDDSWQLIFLLTARAQILNSMVIVNPNMMK